MFNWSTTRRNAVENHTINGHKLQNMMKRLLGPDLDLAMGGCSAAVDRTGDARERLSKDARLSGRCVPVCVCVCDGPSQLQN